MRELAYLNKYLLKYKWPLALGITFIFVYNIFATYIAPVAGESLNTVLDFVKKNQGMADGPTKDLLIQEFKYKILIYFLTMLGCALLAGFFLFYYRKIIIGVSRKIEYDLKNELYNHYQQLPVSFYKKNNTGDLMNRISEDVSLVRNYLGPCLMYGINLVAIFAVTIYFMLAQNGMLTFFTLIPLPILALSIYWVHSSITVQSEAIQKSQSALSTHVQEAFSGIRVIKSFVREQDSISKFEIHNKAYQSGSIKLVKTQALFFPAIMTLIGASNILVVYIGGLEVMKGTIDAGNIAEFFLYLNRMSWPVASLGWISSQVQRAEVSQGRINEFLKTTPDIVSGSNETKLTKGEIRFENVSFTYPDTGIEALKNINLVVRGGEKIAVVGNTGSGKSTLAALIVRAYDPTKGGIYLDESPIKNLSLTSYRSTIGYVPQDVFLFSDTIRQNIVFGADHLSESNILKAAQNADLYTTIQDFPQGLDTIVGERGITLSGGQKQRLSIARAIVRNPHILVLDDCLSAVDTHTENTILMNLEGVMKHKTSIIISHRISSVKLADRIVVLHEGQVAEVGTHDELLAKNGLYKEMYQKQLQES